MRHCLFLFVLLTACDGVSNTRLPGPSGAATLSHDCGPDDSPALILRIGPGVSCDEPFVAPDAPWVSISIWSGLPQADGDSVETVGTSWWYRDGGDANAQMASDGTVTFDSYAPNRSASGSYTIVLGATERSGRFEATFCDEDPECG